MLRSVTGGGQGPEAQSTEVDLVAVVEPSVAELEAARRGRKDSRSRRAEGPAAGHEVGVQVRLGAEGKAPIPLLGPRLVGGDIARGIDDQ